MLDDFKRLWETRFLDDLSVEVSDYIFENGVVGKLVTYHLEERQRIKVVDYDGATKVDRSAIEDRLKEKNLQIRLDSFIDPGVLRGVAATVRNLYAEKGYQFAEVTPEIRETGAAKTVNVTFHVTEGPRVAIRGQHLIDEGANCPERMIFRNALLRRHIAEHRVGLGVGSSHARPAVVRAIARSCISRRHASAVRYLKSLGAKSCRARRQVSHSCAVSGDSK
jgi:outer membrane protein assembly factor BamA